MGKLDGKVALITGASSGIGKGAAVRLAQEGAKIGMLGHDRKHLEEAAKDVRGECVLLEADVASPDAMKKAADQLAREFGTIDIVFANAGINGVWAPLDELEPDEWDRTLNTNLKGTYLTVKYALPYLQKQGGAIVITSSVNGTRIFSNTGATAYSCSKAGQVAFCKMVALEQAKHKIRVNAICPGWIETNIEKSTVERDINKEKEPVEYPHGEVPLTRGKPGKAEQVAELVLFLVSDASSHITGTEVFIDGAESLLVG
ncbi:MAG: hypothetical protein QOJ65_1291 [Fimbriimonadaceae bacterium]|jgi:NAD(P)-dependent dehydrogenase (short-subunit alcohol dehydrogenase family)|nr:hypothetical protein [Fimbriimonadaceae bacterium]